MHLLVIRFSAMGDVALLTPALVAITSQFPRIQITLATRGSYAPFFYNIPNITVVGLDLKEYRGLIGIWNFFKELNKLGPYHKVIDLHASLRSRILSLLYKWKGIPTFRIVKGRLEKKRQTQKKDKILQKLPHTVDRYLNVFERAGFKLSPRKGPWINTDPDSKIYASNYLKKLGLQKNKDKYWIGFAPFAGHALKIWPFSKSIELILAISKNLKSNIFLFGSPDEMSSLNTLKEGNPNCYIVMGESLGLRGELGVMEKMDIMIGMDSSNIHLAALLGKPVIAIFGTTHPYSGFGPYKQDESGVIQVDLECRPCSIYGNTVCHRKDFACMELISIEKVIEMLKYKLQLLDKKRQIDLYNTNS